MLLATATVTGLAYARGRAAVLADARAELSSRARLSADRVDRAVRERVRLAALWPRLSTSQDLAVDDVDKRVALSLEELASHLGGGAVALAVDTTGRIAAASTPAWMGRSARGEPWYRPLPAGASGASTLSVPSPVPLLAVTSPVHSAADSALLGYIVLLSPWRSVVPAREEGSGPTLALHDAAGRTLLEGDDILRRDTTGLLAARAPAGGSGLSGLEVIVAMPRSAALVPLRGTTRSLLLLATLVLAVTLPGTVLLARSTTAELRRLTVRARQAEQTGRADFGGAGPAAPVEVRVLAGALQSMVERLESSQRELAQQESLAAMGAMAAGLAHEVRTPLSVIRASAEMLARRAESGSREGELASFVMEETDRLSRLVDDLLAYARPREPNAEATDLAAVAARAARVQGIGGDAVKLESQFDPAPVTGDPEQLFQVVLNLLSNAVQASPQGAVVHLATSLDGNDAVLEVVDRGGGISAEDSARVWTPFFSRRSGGTGLGLPIVRRIVEGHRGSVSLEPAAGGGTRAVVRLPRRRNEVDR